MSTPAPKLPEETPHPLTPSTSTVVSVAAGAPLVLVVTWVLDQFFHVQIPPEVAASLGAVVSTIVGYFGNGGRAVDTQ